MEREVSHAIELGAVMMAIAALLSIVWFTVFMGRGLANDMTVEASNIAGQVSVVALDEIEAKGGEEMPAAAAYSIIKTYDSYINNYTCNNFGHDRTYLLKDKSPCLSSHLQGMVLLEIEQTSEGYNVTVTKKN